MPDSRLNPYFDQEEIASQVANGSHCDLVGGLGDQIGQLQNSTDIITWVRARRPWSGVTHFIKSASASIGRDTGYRGTSPTSGEPGRVFAGSLQAPAPRPRRASGNSRPESESEQGGISSKARRCPLWHGSLLHEDESA
jgi:hypothetical protein